MGRTSELYVKSILDGHFPLLLFPPPPLLLPRPPGVRAVSSPFGLAPYLVSFTESIFETMN